MNFKQQFIPVALAACLLGQAPLSHATSISQKALRPAVVKYLQQRGNLCLGKFAWPVDVSNLDTEHNTDNAVQMPVLEKIGLVSSSTERLQTQEESSAPGATVTHYQLTPLGQQFYLPVNSVTLAPGDKAITHPRDFCAAKLTLDKIVSLDPPQAVQNRPETTVTYTYRVSAADWTKNPEVLQVFPMLDKIIKGERSLQLKQRFRLTNNSWSAVNLWE